MRNSLLFGALTTSTVVLLLVALLLAGAVKTDPRSGPISIYPRKWTTCNGTGTGFASTTVDVPSYWLRILANKNQSLTSVYNAITNTPDFTSHTFGDGWATTSWGGASVTGLNKSYDWIIGDFVLTRSGQPAGYLQGSYDIFSGTTLVAYFPALRCVG